jgi:hypothetical protein
MEHIINDPNKNSHQLPAKYKSASGTATLKAVNTASGCGFEKLLTGSKLKACRLLGC